MSRRSCPPPPGAAPGYEFEVVFPGPPVYFGAPPAPAASGGITPAGEGAPYPATDDFAAAWQLARTRRAQADFAAAVPLFERAAEAARRAGDTTRHIAALRALAATHRDSGQANLAVAVLADIVRVCEASGDRPALTRALVRYGTQLRRVGRLEEAAAVLERALAAGSSPLP